MIGQARSFLGRSLQQQARYGSMVQTSSRGFAGGGGEKKPPIDAKETNFDLILVGKSSQITLLIIVAASIALFDLKTVADKATMSVSRWPQLRCSH